jgi:hypothetical protein
MTDNAPERIWVEKSIAEKGNHGSTAWPETDEDSDIEYVRADLCTPTQDERVQALEAENARLRESLRWFTDTRFTSSGETPRDCIQAGIFKARAALRDMEPE